MDFVKLLQDLVAGKVKQIEINEDNFFAFNQAWLACPQHKQIIGTAAHDGKVIYRFSENESK
ncbi:hypothetical protein DS831_08525 [Bombilactobacillus bombi]|jgi:hypothetical protein|uniref:Uncharacterized protein n=1 Tax=Bombilactobacillus bombi TaxID=1303590 RepID=A0A417ZFT9_9LACO|nr:hypothetical protein [Bombilactobacillus bombi]MCO6541817.1 hypothetical protein [Lactobacillus sp.]RHW50190.1 hypothetical protein DS831_08525 [Bombilactobacillus bombi]